MFNIFIDLFSRNLNDSLICFAIGSRPAEVRGAPEGDDSERRQRGGQDARDHEDEEAL